MIARRLTAAALRDAAAAAATAAAAITAVLADVAADAVLQRARGVLCPICHDRTRNLTAHVFIDHTTEPPLAATDRTTTT